MIYRSQFKPVVRENSRQRSYVIIIKWN